jgi:hypothetical protein
MKQVFGKAFGSARLRPLTVIHESAQTVDQSNFSQNWSCHGGQPGHKRKCRRQQPGFVQPVDVDGTSGEELVAWYDPCDDSFMIFANNAPFTRVGGSTFLISTRSNVWHTVSCGRQWCDLFLVGS